jgi:hypothetical protein
MSHEWDVEPSPIENSAEHQIARPARRATQNLAHFVVNEYGQADLA